MGFKGFKTIETLHPCTPNILIESVTRYILNQYTMCYVYYYISAARPSPERGLSRACNFGVILRESGTAEP